MDKLEQKIEQQIEEGLLERVKDFQPGLLGFQYSYMLHLQKPENAELKKTYEEFGYISNNFVHEFYGVKPTQEYYYRR